MGVRENSMKSRTIKLMTMSLVMLVVGIAALIWMSHRANEARGVTDGPDTAPASSNEPAPSMVEERMGDPEYNAALMALTDERRETVSAAADVRASMQKLADEAVQQILEAKLEASPELVHARTRENPLWSPLEAELAAHQTKLADIGIRTQKLIGGRMNEQYAAMDIDGPTPRQGVTIKRAPQALDLPTEPIVVTNRPGDRVRQFPVQPVRTPVPVTREPVGVPTP